MSVGVVETWSPDRIRAMRAARQNLAGGSSPRLLTSLVRELGGVNAQAYPAMLLSLRARVGRLESGSIARRLESAAGLVRVWSVRGTLHLHEATQARSWTALVSPELTRRDRRRRLQLGLTDERLAQGVAALRKVLIPGKPQTKESITSGLSRHGFRMDVKSQAPYHVLRYAGLQGLVRLGPEQGGRATFLPWPRLREDARAPTLEELALGYLRAFAPADAADFAAWSGLPRTAMHAVWPALVSRGQIRTIGCGNRRWWVPEDKFSTIRKTTRAPGIRMLPAFDEAVLGYADRSLLVPPDRQRDVYHGGQTVPVIWVDGRAAGTWGYSRKKNHVEIHFRAFSSWNSAVRRGIREEAKDIARFWGVDVRLQGDPS